MRMRELVLGSVAAIAMAGSANAATGWYMSLGAGANWIEDGSVDTRWATGSYHNENTWNDGYIVSGAVGYDFGEHWRAEFEVAYRDNNGKGYCSENTCEATPVEVWELSQMFNAIYDISLGGNWEASVGAGVGGNLVVLKGYSSTCCEGPRELDDYVLAGQLIAQASYQLSDRWKAFAGYNYMFMDDPEVLETQDPTYQYVVEKTEHSLQLGLRFDLQRDGAGPAPKQPDQPKAGAPKQFIVFFGFNKSNLTPEAQRVVSEAAAAAKETGSASIAVVGHTDTSGSSDYNVKLSLRRSQAVKDALVSLGIPEAGIATGGRGESELMVQTGDGVKEPQNRRATIDLK